MRSISLSYMDQWVGLVGWKVGGAQMEEADPTDHHRSVPYSHSDHRIQTRCHVTHCRTVTCDPLSWSCSD